MSSVTSTFNNLFNVSDDFLPVKEITIEDLEDKKHHCTDCQNREVAAAVVIAQTYVEMLFLQLLNIGNSYNTAKYIMIEQLLFEPEYDTSMLQVHPSVAEPYIKLFKDIQMKGVIDLRDALNSGDVQKREKACLQIHRFEVGIKHMKSFCNKYPSY